MKNQKNTPKAISDEMATMRTHEDVQKELQEAEVQKKVWQKRVDGLKREAKSFEPTDGNTSKANASVRDQRRANRGKTPITLGTLDEEAEVAEEVTETPAEEAEVTEEVTETPAEEAEVTEEVTETPVEEAEVTEEVTETPVEEAEVAEEVTETPVEEGEVAEEVTETPDEEAEVAEEVTETPVEETETSNEEEDVSMQEPEEPAKDKKSFATVFCGLMAAVCLIAVCIMAAIVANRGNDQTPPVGGTNGTGDIVDTTDTNAPTGPEPPADSVNPEQSEFDMNEFLNSVVKIAEQLTDDGDIAANVDILVEDIGEDKLKELIAECDEINVKKAIAEMLAFVPEAKMQQYITQNGLDYNPNAAVDYSSQKQALNEAYIAATGKNPDGALMSLPGYDSYKGNRDALRALIRESGDEDLLTWYNAKMEIYDIMLKQSDDTEAAEAYKKSVKEEMLANKKGTEKLLELQLEKEAAGQLTVMDNVSGQYTEEYYNFVLDNYIYVIAN